MKSFKFGDLFCGCGGTSRGLTDIGGKSQFGIDFNAVQSEVYKSNFGHCTTRMIQSLSHEEIELLPDIDLLAASPPCQGYSEARRKDLPQRGDMAVGLDILPYIRIKKPSFIFLENVRGYHKKPVLNQIEETLIDLGYHVESKVVNMANWGVPQSRIRTIMLASNQKSFQFPFRNEKHVGWGHGLDAATIARCEKVDFTKHQLARLPAKLAPMSLIERAGASSDQNLTCRYYHEPSFTMKALKGHWRQMDIWTGDRLYGVSIEVARNIQGFPPHHLLPINNQLAWYGMGNSVPPLFVSKLISAFLELF